MPKIRQVSSEPDGATAVAHEIDNTVDLVTDGAKILSIKEAGVEKFSVNKDGVILSTGYEIVVPPEDGWAGIRTAATALIAAGGGTIRLLEGTYDLDDNISLTPNATTRRHNLNIVGMGDGTIINHDTAVTSTGFALVFGTLSSSAKNIQNVSIGDTQIITNTFADAGFFKAGDHILIHGDDAEGIRDSQTYVVKIDGNPVNGQIELDAPIRTVQTSPSVTGRAGGNIVLKDFRMVLGPTPVPVQSAISIGNVENVRVEGLSFDNYNNRCIGIGAQNFVVERCRFENNDGDQGRIFSFAHKGVVRDNLVRFCGATINDGGFQMIGGCADIVFENNKILNVTGIGIEMASVLGPRRMVIKNNTIVSAGHYGIRTGNTADVTIHGNLLENCTSAAIEIGSGRRIVITGNQFRDLLQGIRTQGGDEILISGNYFTNVVGASSISLQFFTGVSDVTVSGNVFFGCTRAVLSQINNATIVGNAIDGNSVSGSEGISLQTANSIRNSVTGNVCRNHVGNGIIVDNLATDNLIVANNCNGDGISEGTGSGNVFGLNKE